MTWTLVAQIAALWVLFVIGIMFIIAIKES